VMPMTSCDLNCDMGEGFGVYRLGFERELMPYVSSISIACGFHAGDPSTMRETIALAKAKELSVGAHPGYPDLIGFGRRPMQLTPGEVYDAVVYQVGAFLGVAKSLKIEGTHVKVHGALYNAASADITLASAVARAVRAVDGGLTLVGLAGGKLIEAGLSEGLCVAREAFADRRYHADGSLVPRSHPLALYHSFAEAKEQVRELLTTGCVTSLTGEKVAIAADTICVHGDSAPAVEFASGLRSLMTELGVALSPLTRG